MALRQWLQGVYPEESPYYPLTQEDADYLTWEAYNWAETYHPAVDDLREIAEQREKHRLFHCVLSTGKRYREETR